ncbi:hypothetical protein SAMN02745163_03026 [Clostridium cavendishii DSM 21758]|uniref:Uncharacterized protein n=1 Tax=Clostridium cavendishii DSM 21758 TaxID=1121302 RepID=A0A1M6NUX0_9CLOT|nr:hypothetical protein [Clostridium cavendishii]SHJ99506.1 hypothetical protein SAMN02745163_03026 [Clostridium cavendishii DSM 21758]
MNDNIDNKIFIVIGLILFSPLIGTLLFHIYSYIIGFLISTNITVNMIWFSCILSVNIIGIIIAKNGKKLLCD